jgi:hypothetical protein
MTREPSRGRAAFVGLGILALAASLLAPALLACSCDDGPPRIRGCRDPITDFSGLTDVQLVNAMAVRGLQGGWHFQFQIAATGTGLRGCVAQRSELLAGGTAVSVVEDAVSSDVSGTSLLSTPVYHFQGLGGTRRLRVTTLGRTLELDVDTSDPLGRPLDAGLTPADTGLGTDAGLVDVGAP